MLNIDMKRKINTLRDILVGRIPDPKTQVDQITLAMIYKFMDDMDTEFSDSEWGGQRRFFLKTEKMNYEKYAWSNIMQPQVSGEERSVLYREGVESMSRNPHIPQLFRDIYNNAFIPFRDSETINMFLKEINDFKYDNSEDLGNAFEMLLSIMGSQGDAGQFRTPRHIIDMIVAIIDPNKDETVLDPACGTAGFLISAYKHILKKNLDEKGKSDLTPEERKALNQNIVGYDISPDMIRLSSVNMYLHHFPNPSIHNYDTLTSETRWDDNFDVILANPPFMTPKGGINPHKRFRVQAKRSEVLFVDYIAEHLNPNGKAGIIVPEGIVFQTSNAYKQLRKMLIEDNYLYAVISLPAGVFNPYSGVKTSILLFDRTIAKQAENILFVKIDNDGYDLGAQRRDIKGSHIPQTIEVLKKYKKAIISGQLIEFEDFESDNLVLATKEEILEKDYVLVGERYRKIDIKINAKWKLVNIGDVCTITRGASPRPIKKHITSSDKGVNWIKIGDGNVNSNYINKTKEKITLEGAEKSRLVLKGDLILSNSMSYGKPYIMGIDGYVHDGWLIIKDKDNNYHTSFLCLILASDEIQKQYKQLAVGGVVNNLNSTLVRGCKIPLPPLSVQQEIVEEIEGYQKIIDGARQVVENYKPVIKIDPEWDMVELGTITDLITKGTTPTTNGYKFTQKGVSFIKIESINKKGIITKEKISYISEECHNSLKRSQLKENDILFSIAGTKMGICAMVQKSILPANTNQALAIIRVNKNVSKEYIFQVLRGISIQNEIENIKKGVAQFNLSLQQINKLQIPLPEPEIQNEIVKNISREQNYVDKTENLIEIFEQKIKDKISEVWGE